MKEEKRKKVGSSIGKIIRKRKHSQEQKRLKISDNKHGEGAHVGHLLNRIKAREVELTFCCVVLFLAIILIVCYFIFSSVQDRKDFNMTKVGELEVVFQDRGETLGNVVNLTPVDPVSDLDAGKLEAYEVEIENTSDQSQDFQIRLLKDVAMVQEDGCSEKQIPYPYIHYQVDDGDIFALDATKRSPIIYTMSLKAHEKIVLPIRIWVADSLPSEYRDYHYHGNLVVRNVESIK